MNPHELLSLLAQRQPQKFDLRFLTVDGVHTIPDMTTMSEALFVPKLNRAFAARILNTFQSHHPETDTSNFRAIMSKNSSDLWEDLTKELADFSHHYPKLYSLFSLHRFRCEFVKPTFDIESYDTFLKWNKWQLTDIAAEQISRGKEYSITDKTIYISCKLHEFHNTRLFYGHRMLPIQLKYAPTSRITYAIRWKSIKRDFVFPEISDLPTQLPGESKEAFKNRRDEARKKQNKEASDYKSLGTINHLPCRFSMCAESVSFWRDFQVKHDENLIRLHEEVSKSYIEQSENAEGKRRQESRKSNIQIVGSLDEIEPVLHQCQFCYRYKIDKPKPTVAKWHCDRPDCESAYDAWRDDLYSKGTTIEGLRLM